MNIEEFRHYCISKPGVTEDLPFGPQTLVFKVMNKMFALCDIDQFNSFNAKCDPERAIELSATFTGIKPGYHMNKVHWNTIECDGSIPDNLMFELVDHSYDLVKSTLKKAEKEELEQLAKK